MFKFGSVVLGLGLLAAVTAQAATQDYDGVYVGRPVSVAGGCADATRDFALSIEGSDAKMVYDLRGGRMLIGHVSPAGIIRMALDSGAVQVNFDGHVDGDRLIGTTVGSGTGTGPACTFSWSMMRK